MSGGNARRLAPGHKSRRARVPQDRHAPSRLGSVWTSTIADKELIEKVGPLARAGGQRFGVRLLEVWISVLGQGLERL